MSGNEQDTICIKSSAAGNGLTSIIIGALLLVLGLVVIFLLPEGVFLLGVLLISLSIIALIIGAYKLGEPQYSMNITRQHIFYQNRKGHWHIEWENVQRIDVPRVYRGLEHVDLEMIGIRLKDPLQVLDNTSPRLITHLLMEQRPLLTKAMQNDACQSGKCYGDDLIDDTQFKTKEGRVLNGVAAMFANRMDKLANSLGYHIYISANDVDRNQQEFVTLLRECQQNVLENQIN